MLFKASAPGSLMILGEYAVLHGKTALVGAIDQRISVTLRPRQDQQIQITSALGQHTTTLSTLTVVEPFQFVLTAISYCLAMSLDPAHKARDDGGGDKPRDPHVIAPTHADPAIVPTPAPFAVVPRLVSSAVVPRLVRGIQSELRLVSGFDLHIESDFSSTIGFGSSAAVTVATLSVLFAYLNISISDKALIQFARRVIRSVQTVGSGADVAASVLGGVVAYRAKPFAAEKLPSTFSVCVKYSGSKTRTHVAIQHIQQKFSSQRKLYAHLISSIGVCAERGIQAVREKNWNALGELMNIQQGLMQSLGVHTDALEKCLAQLHADENILGAKISGSGLGDCVIGLSSPHSLSFPRRRESTGMDSRLRGNDRKNSGNDKEDRESCENDSAINFSAIGVTCEKI
ncbi:MAG: hypothetical protein SFW66_04590 [Gammaproteobacteria bacterium]|nr:hypothetical protein [Gammaproteobacteria bacterium]